MSAKQPQAVNKKWLMVLLISCCEYVLISVKLKFIYRLFQTNLEIF